MSGKLISRPFSRRHLISGAAGAATLPLVSRPAAAKSAKQASETIDFWYWGTPTILDGFAKAIEAFEEANPGVKVNATTAPYQDFYQKLQPNLAAGTQPDLSLMEALNLVSYQKRDFIQSWDPYVQDLDLSLYYPTLIDDLNRIPFGPSGQLWGLPIYQHTWVLVYNKELFDAAGVKYPDASWTWQTWEETAAALTGGDTYGWGGGSGFYEPWTGMVQLGKNMLDDAHQVVQFDSPEGVRTVEHLANLYTSSGGVNNADLQAMNVPLILTGQVAMDTNHTHNLTQDAFTTSEVPWDLAVYPPQATPDLPQTCMGFGDSLVLYSKAKNPEGAAALAKFLLEDPFQSDTVTSWGLMPILKSAMGSFLENAPAGRAFAAASDQLEYMHSFQVTDDFYGWYGEIFNSIFTAIDEQTSPEEIAKTLGTNANNKLQEILNRP
jgi:multiple sugar transport system substrate-binding protein